MLDEVRRYDPAMAAEADTMGDRDMRRTAFRRDAGSPDAAARRVVDQRSMIARHPARRVAVTGSNGRLGRLYHPCL